MEADEAGGSRHEHGHTPILQGGARLLHGRPLDVLGRSEGRDGGERAAESVDGGVAALALAGEEGVVREGQDRDDAEPGDDLGTLAGEQAREKPAAATATAHPAPTHGDDVAEAAGVLDATGR